MSKEKSEFDRFSNLTKRLLSVSKKELDKRHEEWAKEEHGRHKPKKPSGRASSRDSGACNE